jgi:hypothetical protein
MKHQTQIQQLLKWSDEQYGQFIYSTAIAYLHKYIPGDADGIANLERDKIFWGWFKNQWNIRDNEFLMAVNGLCKDDARALYFDFNSSQSLVEDMWPPHQLIKKRSLKKSTLQTVNI